MPEAFTPQHICKYEVISHLASSPHSDIAVCELQSPNVDSDSTDSAIWALPLNGSPAYRFTVGSDKDSSPRWSPDGNTLAFMSSRSGNPQIHLIARDGGEAWQLSRMPSGASSAEWSPDGKKLLALCSMSVDSEKRGGPHREPDPNKDLKQAPKVCWRLPYKMDGTGFTLDMEIHLFTVDAASGEHRQLTSKPIEVRSASWSPDSRRIVYTRTREGRLANRTDVWIIDADGKNDRQLTRDVAVVMSPRWSPDGEHIVFAGSAEEGDAQVNLWLANVTTGKVRALGDRDIEVSGSSIYWSPDSNSVYFNRVYRGCGVIARIAVEDGNVDHIVTGERQFAEFVLLPDKLIFIAESLATSNQVYLCDLDGTNERQLGTFNSWWEDMILPAVELRQFDVPDGEGGTEQIDGWLLSPPNAQGPAPLLVDIHGGPASYVLLQFAARPYWMLLVSKGWRVVSLNPVGSSSYGAEFSDRLRQHWGEYDLEQQLAAVRTLQDEDLADARVAIAGKSYGGYLSAWAITQSSLFRAAVICAPVSDLESHFGTSDSGYYADHYSMIGGRYSQHENYTRLSPLTHSGQSRTPALLIQGEADERCPKGQSEQMFVCLMRNNDEVPVEMVLYPGGDHHFYETGKPSHRIDVHGRLVDWVTKWIDVALAPQKPEEGANNDSSAQGSSEPHSAEEDRGRAGDTNGIAADDNPDERPRWRKASRASS